MMHIGQPRRFRQPLDVDGLALRRRNRRRTGVEDFTALVRLAHVTNAHDGKHGKQHGEQNAEHDDQRRGPVRKCLVGNQHVVIGGHARRNTASVAHTARANGDRRRRFGCRRVLERQRGGACGRNAASSVVHVHVHHQTCPAHTASAHAVVGALGADAAAKVVGIARVIGKPAQHTGL